MRREKSSGRTITDCIAGGTGTPTPIRRRNTELPKDGYKIQGNDGGTIDDRL